MNKITPLGSRILVAPLPKATFVTETSIQLTESLERGKVMEVSPEISNLYKKGDIVMFSEGAGIGQYYKQQQCLWLDGSRDIWGIIEEEKVTL